MKTARIVLLLLTAIPASSHAMVFRPADVHMWDTWCFHQGSTWYLYYLISSDWREWDGVGVATSKDGVHWEVQGQPIRKREQCVWLGTGSTWLSPHHDQDSTFHCNFSEQPQGEAQHIYFAESTDLIHWRRSDVEFRQDARWYDEQGRWDCIYTIRRPGGGLYGYWTATPRGSVGFGFGESDDGLRWKSLPPPALDWGANAAPDACEIGAVESIGGRYYALVGHSGTMSTFVADCPQGPFRATPENFHVLRGDCYFSRFFPSPGGLLVTHHSITHVRRETKPVCYAAPLKRAVIDDKGTLRLMWWEGNNGLRGEERVTELQRHAGSEPVFLAAPVDVRRGTILEGTVRFTEGTNLRHPGVFMACERGPGGAIVFQSSSAAVAGTLRDDGSGFAPDPRHTIDRSLPAKPQARFRILIRHSLVESYVDDVLFNVFSLPQPASGRVGFLEGAAGIGDLKAWTMNLSDEEPPR
jgi:hypothetical protein